MKYFFAILLPGLVLGSLALFYSIANGLLGYVFIGWCLLSGLGIAVGFHRVFSHKTHSLKKWLELPILFLGTMAGQGSSISWVAVHRGYHHRFSDTPKDLHSPVAHGFFSSLLGWYLKVNHSTINHKYAVELLRDKHHVFFHKHYIKIVYLVAIAFAVFSPPLFMVYMSSLFISLLQDNLVNALCHTPRLGYRNFDTADKSVNFWPLGYFGWGQGWHNNHHARAGEFDFGVKWWEMDPCILWIPLLKLASR